MATSKRFAAFRPELDCPCSEHEYMALCEENGRLKAENEQLRYQLNGSEAANEMFMEAMGFDE